jgi:hypothetical protein
MRVSQAAMEFRAVSASISGSHSPAAANLHSTLALISTLTNIDKSAFTLGIQFGLEHRRFTSWGSVAVNGGIEVGGLYAFGDSPTRASGYVSGTAGAEITIGVTPRAVFGLDLSAGGEPSADHDAQHWVTIGGRLGFSF